MKPFLFLIGLLAGGGLVFGYLHDKSSKLEADLAKMRGDIDALNKAKGDAAKITQAVQDKPQAVAKSDAPEPTTPAAPQTPDLSQLMKAAQPFVKSMIAEGAERRKEMADRMIEEQLTKLTAELGLTPEQQAAFRQYFNNLAAENEAKIAALGEDSNMDMRSVMTSMRDMNPQKALDEYMTKSLTGDQLAKYETNKLGEKAKQIEERANSRLDRMGRDLALDEAQKDQVFQILVQNDKNYDPTLKVHGSGGTAIDAPTEKIAEEEAIAAVLNDDQKVKYQEQQARRQKDQSRREQWMKMMGMEPGDMEGMRPR